MGLGALISRFVRHRNAANLLMALMLIVGIFAGFRLNTQFFPDFGIDIISVTVQWPGAAAEDVEANIVAAIEPEVRFLDSVKKVTSYAVEGLASIVVEFEPGADMQAALSNVDSAVAQITTLPDDAERPKVSRVVRYDPISRLVVSGPYSEASLKAIAKRLRDDLLDRGIDKVDLFGARDEEIRVSIPSAVLRRLDLTLGDIAARIAGSSLDLPSGTLSGDFERQIRSIGQVKTAPALAKIEVRSLASGEKIYLGDIATLAETFDKDEPVGLRHGQPAIELSIRRAVDTDALKAAEIVESYLAEIRPTLPPDLKLETYDVQVSLIRDRINLLLRNGASGLALVLLVLFVFLSGRVAFWVAMGIPVSVFATGGVMVLTGQSINMVSLFAMIMTLGIIVDDAIVVGEHAVWRRGQGLGPIEAAETGALRMMAPVSAAALTTIAAFFPLLMIGDIIGQIIFAIPLVVISVLVASLVECFLVLPGHLRNAFQVSGRRVGRFRAWFDGHFDRFRDHAFRRFVRAAVDWRYLTIATSIAALVLTIGMIQGERVEFEFFPSVESDVINANILMVPGTPRARTKQVVLATEAALKRAEAKLTKGKGGLVVMSFGRIGVSQGNRFARTRGDHLGGLQVELKPSDKREIRTPEVIRAWRAELEPMAGLKRVALNERRGGPPGRELDIRLSGGDTAQLKRTADAVKVLLASFDGVSDIEDDLPYGKRDLILELKPFGRALGFTTESVGRQVRNAFQGAIAKKFARGDEEVTIRVQHPVDETSAADLAELYLRAPGGAEVPLSQIVSFREEAGFQRTRRHDGRREVAVFAEIDESRTNANKVIEDLSAGRLAALTEPAGLSFRFAGKAEEQAQTLGDMRIGAMVGLAAIYIVLAWVFASYAKPIIVMSIIPFGLVGAIIGHYLLGYTLTILSLVALLGLSGILVNNSIILVSTIDERLADGQDRFEAIVDGTCDRLRAVLLTSLTTIGGLLPLMFETSLQAQFLIPMALTIVFGLMVASLLVLVVVPALLGILDDIRDRLGLGAAVTPSRSGG